MEWLLTCGLAVWGATFSIYNRWFQCVCFLSLHFTASATQLKTKNEYGYGCSTSPDPRRPAQYSNLENLVLVELQWVSLICTGLCGTPCWGEGVVAVLEV